jgi:hypothetical protein
MKVCTCKHTEAQHVLCIGQCCECPCNEFVVDELESFFSDYEKCAANSSFPKLADVNAFEPQGKQTKNKGKN